MMAIDSCPRWPLIRARLPMPRASSCHMGWTLKSSRPTHWLRLLLGPRPKMPAWSSSLGVWKPLSRMFGDEGARLLAADRRHGRLDQGLSRGQFGAIGQGDGHQVVDRPGRVDQRDLRVVVLQRLDDGPGVEPEHLGQVGALDPPFLLGRRPRVVRGRPGGCGPGRSRLEGRAPRSGSLDPLDEVLAALDRVERAGVDASILMDEEVGVGGALEGVVLGRLDVPVTRAFSTCRAASGS